MSTLGNRPEIQLIIDSLPILGPQDLKNDEDSCPICLVPFSSIFQEESLEMGVTKLAACNHTFCRKDLTEWIQRMHGNCPTCRNTFLEIKPPSESDDESSDGGEYIPGEHDDDFDDMDEDAFYEESEGFSSDWNTGDEWQDEEDGDRGLDADMEDGIDWEATDDEASFCDANLQP